MIGKGYYAALVVADSDTLIEPNPAEISDWVLASAGEYRSRIVTNRADKMKILREAWLSLIDP
jgi:hypothetical protein